MNYSALLTPDMLDLLLPLLGFSILLNFVLLAALLFRPVYHRLLDQMQTAKIGIQMALRQNEQSS